MLGMVTPIGADPTPDPTILYKILHHAFSLSSRCKGHFEMFALDRQISYNKLMQRSAETKGSIRLSRRDFIKVAGTSVAAGLTSCTPIGRVLSEIIQTPTSTNTKTPTPRPTVTPKPTEIPKPEIPAEIIVQSLDLIETDPVKEKDTGDWVITDLRERNTQIFWRWDSKNKAWLDERPLYWQCGRTYSVDSSGYDSSVTAEARNLPTGLWGETPVGYQDYYTFSTVRACITKAYNPPTEPFFGVSILGKIGFFDLDGKIHEYDIGLANTLSNGKASAFVFGLLGGSHRTFTSALLPEAAVAVSEFYHYPSQFATRVVLVDLLLGDSIGTWNYEENLFKYRDIALQLIEALKTGKGFPENVPADFFLWTQGVHFIGGFKPSSYKG